MGDAGHQPDWLCGRRLVLLRFLLFDVALCQTHGAAAVGRAGAAMSDQMTSSAMPPPLDKPVVELISVHKWFGAFHVLRDVSLTVRRGERIVIAGPSGGGKSTLIRCINAIERHQQGRIIVNGVELTSDLKRIDEVRRDVAWYSSSSIYSRTSQCLRIARWRQFGYARCRRRKPKRLRCSTSNVCASPSRPTNIRANYPAVSSNELRSRALSA